jgi:xylulokinase
MVDCVIACDLGTGGNKAALFRSDGVCVAETVVTYPTFYPAPGYHEQRPTDWWQAVVESVRALLARTSSDPHDVAAIVLSGQSLGCIPLDADGALLAETTPIWSDGRAETEAADFSSRFDGATWYTRTGNGFPMPLYSVFKAMWLRRHAPEAFARTRHIVGSKDYINFRLTGRIATDPSYASGSGVYDLLGGSYSPELIAASGLDPELFPPIVPSTEALGALTERAAQELGLPRSVRVIAGGVDNSCMALGARGLDDGSLYASLGSSSWLTVIAHAPLLDERVRPFVFAHVLPGMFVSATSIFSSGTSFDWVREVLVRDAVREIGGGEITPEAGLKLAAGSPIGARGLLFVPTLGGGTHFEGGPAVRGALLGLDLRHTAADVMRATLEGIALALRAALDELRGMMKLREEMIVVGGGAKSAMWRQLVADVYDTTILKTPVDRQAAALGAAALGFVGIGAWPDCEPLRALHEPAQRLTPDPARARTYARLLPLFRQAAAQQAELAPALAAFRSASSEASPG